MRRRHDASITSTVVGTAGWSIPRTEAAAFRDAGSSLERYAQRFAGVEVNSSFHRSHRRSTWAQWAASVPDRFRFAVKLPKTITHQARLIAAGSLLEQFAHEIEPLGAKLAVILVQLPPKLGFDATVAERFFDELQRRTPAQIACEPRNASWFEDAADTLLMRMRVARVAADPALEMAASTPGGWPGLAYWRLHGSPAMYRSPYSEAAIEAYAARVRAASAEGRNVWCVFDNTAASAATANALSLIGRLASEACDPDHSGPAGAATASADAGAA